MENHNIEMNGSGADPWGAAPSNSNSGWSNWSDMPPPPPSNPGSNPAIAAGNAVVELIGTSEHCRECFRLKPGVNIIGRGKNSDICINYGGISRQHAAIEIKPDGGVELWDLGSANGTSLGGSRLTPEQHYSLQNQDIILFSQVRFTLAIKDEPAAAAAPQAPASSLPETRMEAVPREAAPAEQGSDMQPLASRPTLVNMNLSSPDYSSESADRAGKLAKVEQERRQLAILFHLALRYLTRDPNENPAAILFKVLPKVVPFDAAFIAIPSGDGRFRFLTHHQGIKLAKQEHSHIAREGDPRRTVVFDSPADRLELTTMVVAARAIIPFSNGGCLVLLSKTPGIYAKQVEYLDLLGRLHSTVAV